MRKKKNEKNLDGYTAATIEYHWCGAKNPNCPTAVKANDVELPSYRFAQFCVNRTMATTSSGTSPKKKKNRVDEFFIMSLFCLCNVQSLFEDGDFLAYCRPKKF